jgi:BNR repeat protein
VLALALTLLQAHAPAPRTFDLDPAGKRRIVVDREAGQYLGHPTTVLLADGRTLLCAYPAGHGKGAILLKRSPDGGRTWSKRLPTPASWATSLETPTLHRVADAADQERLLLFSGLHPIRMAHSEDEGARWSELEPIGAFGGIVAMASLEPMHDGSHLAFFHDDGRFFAAQGGASEVFTLYQTRSRDGGLHWEAPRAIQSASEVHLCEPGAVRSPDGEELTLLLRENRRVRPSMAVTTRDEGESWSEPRELASALTGDRHVARYAPDGRLLVTFRDMARDSSTSGDWIAWVGRYEDLARGGGGEYRVRLQDNQDGSDCAYAGLELLPDETFVATTYGHWVAGEPPFVIAQRFTLAELDALAGER